MNVMTNETPSAFDVAQTNDALRLLTEACEENRLTIKEFQRLRRAVLNRLEQNEPPLSRAPSSHDTVAWLPQPSLKETSTPSPKPLNSARKISALFLLFMVSFLLSTGLILAISALIPRLLGAAS